MAMGEEASLSMGAGAKTTIVEVTAGDGMAADTNGERLVVVVDEGVRVEARARAALSAATNASYFAIMWRVNSSSYSFQ